MKNFTLCISICVLLTSCASESYFQSPLHSNTGSYKTIPLQGDSIAAATYIGGTLTFGSANHRLRDGFAGFNGNLFRSHNFGSFQGFYGINAIVGQYNVNYTKDAEGMDQQSPYFKQGDHFFGAVGGTVGLNVVAPFRKGEWRVLGAEMSYQQEFGDYYKFRQKLPVNQIRYVDTRDHYFTWGLSTEILGEVGNHWQLGYKMAYIMSVNPLHSQTNGNTLHPAWFSQTIAVTKLKTTGFVQLNAGTRVFGAQLGVNYRLGH